MATVGSAPRPRYCPECGQRLDAEGRFCGGCGAPLAGAPIAAAAAEVSKATASRTKSKESAPAVDPCLLLAGGWLAMASPDLRRSREATLAITATLVFASSLLALLCWYAQFFYNRPRIDATMLQGIARGAVAACALSVLGNAPLARRATAEPEAGLKAFVGLFVVPLALALFSTAFVGTADEAIAQARREASPAQAPMGPAELDLYAPKLLTPAERAEAKRREIPWNGKGADPNFPVR